MHRRLPLMLATIGFAQPAFALDVIGNINTDTLWTLADSPVHLNGDVTIALQATLTIEPGVVVQASSTDLLGAGADTSRVELIIRGALLTPGTGVDPVRFQGEVPGAAVWSGISFEPGARDSNLSGVHITDADTALWVRSTAPLTLLDLMIEDSTTGILWQSTAPLTLEASTIRVVDGTCMQIEGDGGTAYRATITDSTIGPCQSGVELLGPVDATLERSVIRDNTAGLTAAVLSSVVAHNNLFIGNRSWALTLLQDGTRPMEITNNTIDFNAPNSNASGVGIGISVLEAPSPSDFVIRNNIITNQGIGIKVFAGSMAPSLDHNNVWNNDINYDGPITAGHGSVSTNPLFVENTSPSLTVDDPISVTNPGDNYFMEWTIRHPEARSLRVDIGSVDTESCCDRLTIFDGLGNQVAFYSGIQGPTSTPIIDGDTAIVQFTTDASVLSAGFTVTGYQYTTLQPQGYRLQASSPVIDLGNDLGAPADDHDGSPRPYDGDFDGTPTTDMGAFEWHDNALPTAIAGPDTTVLPNTTVDLTAIHSFDPDGTITAYSWDFGDGSPVETTRDVSHTFAVLGSYDVTLMVTDDQGATDSDLLVVDVVNNLLPVADPGADQFVGVSELVNFNAGASTDSDGTIVNYVWDFGDASPLGSGLSVTHAYASAGTYTVTLTVTDNLGGQDSADTSIVVTAGQNDAPTADVGGPYGSTPGVALVFDGQGSTDPDGTIASYSWDFGDGATGTGATPSHTYSTAGSFLVVLTVTDDQGATDDDSTLVPITAPGNADPMADAGGAINGNVNQPIHFDGSASTDSDGTITSYSWDFGDGTTGTGVAPSHTYSTAGSFLVTLTVIDDAGGSDDDTALVTVAGVAGNNDPVADAGAPQTGLLGMDFSFDGSGSSDSDGTIASYAWDFGDGTTETGVQPTHTYNTAGSFLVTLTVTDDQGSTDDDTVLISVTSPNNELPTADAGPALTGGINQAIAFDGSGSSDPDGSIVSWTWDFSDGSTDSGAQVSHSFATAGSFLVELMVTDDDGAVAQDVVLVTITAGDNLDPIADAGDPQVAVIGDVVTLDGSGSSDSDGSITAYAWDFGDGQIGAGSPSTHTFVEAGSYLVTLVVTDDAGATDDDVVLITVTDPVDDTDVPEPLNDSGCGCSQGSWTGSTLLWGFSALLLVARRRS